MERFAAIGVTNGELGPSSSVAQSLRIPPKHSPVVMVKPTQTLSPKTPHEALALSIHVWMMKAQDHLHVGSASNIVEHRSELSIAIAYEESRSTIERGIAKVLGSANVGDSVASDPDRP
jgi:hypothetical protein